METTRASAGNRAFTVCFWILCLLMNLQFLSVYSVAGDQFQVKAYHLFSLIFVVLILRSRTLLAPPLSVMSYWLVASLTSLVAYMVYRESLALVLLVYAIYCFAVGMHVATRIGYELSVKVLRTVALTMFAAIAIKSVVFYEEFVRFFKHPVSHPSLFVFYGGGINLEATWPALWTVLFLGSRMFYPVLGVATLISVLYASRVGVLIVLSAMLYRVLSRHGRSVERVVPLFLLGVGAMLGLEWLESEYRDLSFVFFRFGTIGEDAGSVNRIALWSAALGAVAQNPFGYGIGNSIDVVERMARIFVHEKNLHNLYLQLLVDTGIQSLIAYCLMIFVVLRREVEKRFRDVLAGCMVLYWVAGTVQFRLYEPMFWLVAGLYFGYERIGRKAGRAGTA